jgi:glycosyltransferase involved in cell wall biosynthesis
MRKREASTGFEAPAPKLLIVDDALADLAGHYYEHSQAIREMHIPLGISTTILANAKFTPESHLDRDIVPLFTRSWMRGDCRVFGRFSFASELLRHSFHIYSRVSSYMRGRYFDCVFISNATIWDGFAYRVLLLTHKRKCLSRIVLLLRYGIQEFQDASTAVGPARRFLWKVLLNSFSAAQQTGEACIATDSVRLAKEFEVVTGVRPVVFPCPKVVCVDRPETANDPTRPYTFASLGAARLEKGIDLLQAATKKILSRCPKINIRFVIQWIGDVRRQDGTLLIRDEILLSDQRVNFIDKALSRDEYRKCLEETDCLVLPYRREKYAARISGIAVEAATSGIPAIYTADTWLSEFLSTYGAGIAFDDGDVRSLSEAMEVMYFERERFNGKARTRRHLALHENSPERMIESLWGRNPQIAEPTNNNSKRSNR